MISDQTRRLARFHLDVAFALSQARERAGLTVDELSELSALTPERIVMIEEGDITSLTEIAQICAALSISIASVLPDVIGSQSSDRPAIRSIRRVS
jgi:transcriptional regulator with XRE-family HTH domain